MQLAEGLQEKSSQTFGGRVASSIRANMQQKDIQAFSEDSLSGDNKHANCNDEVAEFVHRSPSPADTA